jgi:sugar/nucleoside kinase (ribokinase family)
MQPELREALQQESPFLALNCQTNSNNHGFNIISRQYHRADAVTLDTQELMLSSGHRFLDHPVELNDLREHLGAKYAWLTRGPAQTIGLCGEAPACYCPALEADITDTIGAGDAFYSTASLSAARGLPVELGTFLGQLAGAQAVKIVGNAQPVSKSVLLKSGMSLLNF